MMGGLSGKRGVYLSQILEFQHIIYEMEEVFILCLMMYLILRHSSLSNNVFNTYGESQLWVVHSERVIHLQKIKVKKIIFR